MVDLFTLLLCLTAPLSSFSFQGSLNSVSFNSFATFKIVPFHSELKNPRVLQRYHPNQVNNWNTKMYHLQLSNAMTNVQDKENENERSLKIQALSKKFCQLAPLWTLIAALIGVNYSSMIASTVGSLSVMQISLSLLMLSMGLTITPTDFRNATKQPTIVILNSLLCFIMMPMVSMAIASLSQYTPNQTAGIVLLGSVSGGQASNLFALLAGGDVALSVVCTLSTTFLGVLATPLLVQKLLQTVVAVEFLSVLRSVASLVLLPLILGLSTGTFFPGFINQIQPFCPIFGILSTLVLIAGGAANSTLSLGFDKPSVLGSYLLPIIGGALALGVSYLKYPNGKTSATMNEKSRRTLVVETLSKSPTLAYVLARKHFGQAAAAIPAAGMISLAVVGAVVASVWSILAPINDEDL